jgi:hypothetical protein
LEALAASDAFMSVIRFFSSSNTSTRLLGGVLAMLLICGTALLGGMQGAAAAGKTVRSLWDPDAEIPLLNTMAHPKDFKRSPDQRWRHTGDGDDVPDVDQSSALAPQFALPVSDDGCAGYAATDDRIRFSCSFHRPQAARAPPTT